MAYVKSSKYLKNRENSSSMGVIDDILHKVNNVCISESIVEEEHPFDNVKVQYYASGKKGSVWHSCDQAEYIKNDPIAVLTLGAPRQMEFAGIKSKKSAAHLFCNNGSLHIMGRGFQGLFRHRMLKDDDVKKDSVQLIFMRTKKFLGVTNTNSDKPDTSDSNDIGHNKPEKKITSTKADKISHRASPFEKQANKSNNKTDHVSFKTHSRRSNTFTKSSYSKQLNQSSNAIDTQQIITHTSLLEDAVKTLTLQLHSHQALVESLLTGKESRNQAEKNYESLGNSINDLKNTISTLDSEFSKKMSAASDSLCYMTEEFNKLHRAVSQSPLSETPMETPIETPISRSVTVDDVIPEVDVNHDASSFEDNIIEPPKGFRDCDDVFFKEHFDVQLNVADKLGRAEQDLRDLSAAYSKHKNIRSDIQDGVAVLKNHINIITSPNLNELNNNNDNFSEDSDCEFTTRQRRTSVHTPKKDIFRTKRVLFVCDSLLGSKVFDQSKFGHAFQVKTFQIGSYANLSREENMRRLLAYGNIDAYVLALGTNDLRDHYDQNVEYNVETVVDFLATRTSAKIIVSMPPRTRNPCPMGDRIRTFRSRTIEFFMKYSEDVNFKGRVELQDSSLFDREKVLRESSEVFYDNIHFKSRGTSILLGQIKHSLRKAFGMLTKSRTANYNQQPFN